MIRITIELDKWGMGKEIKRLGEMHIFNNLSGTSTSGNYGYKLFGPTGKLFKHGEVRNFKRKQTSVFRLILLALKDAYEK